MYVTCYYDIYGKPERFEEYLALFYALGHSGLPIVLFTDMPDRFNGFPESVIVRYLSLADCELYQMGMNYQGELPGNRSVEKDTKEFFSLMNTKMELVKKAKEQFPGQKQYAWIDFGILKIVKNRERVLKKLKQIEESTYTKVMIPGCWAFGRTFSVNAIHWRFCGGFFVMPSEHVERFFEHSKCVLKDFCTMPMYRLTWETNVWTIIENCAEKDNIGWYFADHNDTMITNVGTGATGARPHTPPPM